MSFSWANWGRNQTCYPKKIFRPENLEELQAVIKEAQAQKVNVHAFGAGHSWSNLVPTSGYLIKTDQLNRLLEVDLEKKQVRVEAGMPLHRLIQHLDAHGLAMTNLGRVTKQSIGGATSTGTHGTGHTPTLASFITEVELVLADGSLHKLSATENGQQFAAARLALGSLGILYSVKLQCESSFVLTDQCSIMNAAFVFEKYAELLQKNDYWMFEWNPYTEKALVYSWNRTRLPVKKSVFRAVKNALKEATFNALTALLRPFPQCTPKLVDLRFWFSTHALRADKSYKVLTRSYLGMRYVECEMSVKPHVLPDAVRELKVLFKAFAKEGKGIYVPRVTFRFVAEEKGSLLSPTYDGNRVFISLVMPAHSAFERVFSEYQKRMRAFEARPHWGKIHFMDQALAEQLYDNNLREFLAIRQTLDPDGLFLNAQLSCFLK